MRYRYNTDFASGARPYAEHRVRIHSGDVLAFQHNQLGWGLRDLQVRLISLFEHSDIVHTGTAVWLNGRLFVLEAVVPYPRIAMLSNCDNFYHMPIAAPWSRATQDRAFALLGKHEEEYSRLEAVKAAFRDDDVEHENGRWQCAKLTWTLAKWDGIRLGDQLVPSEVAAAALWRAGREATTFVVQRSSL